MSGIGSEWWTAGWDRQRRDVAASLASLLDDQLPDELLATWDESSTFPQDALDVLAQAGWSALPVPQAYGGEGATATDLATVHLVLARRSLVVAQTYYSLWVLGAEAIARLGDEAQRGNWLPRIAKGKAQVAFALTEPGSGSDASALRTHAELTPEGWRLTGQKIFITGAANSDIIVTAARSGTGTGRDDISLFLLDPAQPGVVVRPLRKLGLHALDLDEVFLDGALVTQGDVLGRVGDGWRGLGSGLAQERLYLAAISAGALVDVLDRALAHASVRETFGRRIGDHQMIAERLVRMRIDAAASIQLVFHAAALLDSGDPAAATAASVAKLHATESYVSAAREAVQIFGGSGYIEESVVARHYRDSKYLEIGGGTSQVQTIIIARSMGLRP